MKVARLSLLLLAAGLIIMIGGIYSIRHWRSPIKIGILHSLTGDLTISEASIVDAELMAIEEINDAGGILGRKIKPIVVDGKSDVAVFMEQAQRLICQEKVVAIIGCWTSSARRAIRPIIEHHNNLLVYPVSYEGIEESHNIFYAGATQNQQAVPAALWTVQNLGKRVFLSGTDNAFSRLTNAIIKEALATSDAQIVGEEYMLVNSRDVSAIMNQISNTHPEVIINSIYGASNLAFFQELRARGITPEKIPVMTIGSVTEIEFAQIGANALAGDYATASYFQSIDREENNIFVTRFKKKYGQDRVISESEEAGYLATHIWAQAVQLAGSPAAPCVIKHLYNRVFNAPGGIVYSDDKILNMWKRVYVGKLRSDGQFTIVWDSQKPIGPVLYPVFQTKQAWKKLESELYERWGKQWLKAPGIEKK